ncbi:hypothetical protein GMDG_08188 [Pseudogymnoascus destructans 20631-21]|uniref:Uncharacterized protein n=1 Tax=Pseudogymnoascus destructans (strain ATCC MYA-4855 / 20631-21) TaxID=658429 RepID=L8G2B4_PSED2|nr:hypothetical protein GMDG_08188 [Pseudogymnoascus destructans 20631-21]
MQVGCPTERTSSSNALEKSVDGLSSLNDDTPYWLRTANSTEKVENRPMSDRMKDCCELTKFNPEQKQLLEDMLQSLVSGEDDETQVQKMSALMMSMILQSLKGFDRFDSPMIHFAAVLGIVEDEKRLRRGDEYSYMLAEFMYCIRVLFVEHALPAATRGEQTRDNIDQFLELRRGYLVVGSYSPCSFLIKMLGYGKTIEHAENQSAQHYLEPV